MPSIGPTQLLHVRLLHSTAAVAAHTAELSHLNGTDFSQTAVAKAITGPLVKA